MITTQRIQTSWTEVATSAHQILSQTLPDELLDELLEEAPRSEDGSRILFPFITLAG